MTVARQLGINVGWDKLIEMIERYTALKWPIARSTTYTFTQRRLRKLMAWTPKTPFGFTQTDEQNVEQSYQTKSNAGLWLGSMNKFRINSDDQELEKSQQWQPL